MLTRNGLIKTLLDTRARTEELCSPLETEDYVVQPIIDVSPPKWHLGHTTWFFEEFILKKALTDFKPFHKDFAFVFNSYYESIGKRVVRSDRGNLSRPSVAAVYDYRKHVTAALEALDWERVDREVWNTLEIGIHHEKQHQELLLTDIKYILGHNPLLPNYGKIAHEFSPATHKSDWISIPKGRYAIGHAGKDFCFDNELGRHEVYLENFEISNSLVTQADYLEFMEDDGYSQHALWHAEAWDWLQRTNTQAPLYWHKIKGDWQHYTLDGLQDLSLSAPLAHISYYEPSPMPNGRGAGCPLNLNGKWPKTISTGASAGNGRKAPIYPIPDIKKRRVPGGV